MPSVGITFTKQENFVNIGFIGLLYAASIIFELIVVDLMSGLLI
jgi:hypothetical protein